MFFETIWSLLVLTLLLLVIVGGVKVGKLIKEKWGIPATVLFTLIVLILISNSGRNNNWKEVAFKEQAHLNIHMDDHTAVRLQRTFLGQYALDIQFGRDTLTGRYVPVSAQASQTGVIFGNKWIPQNIHVATTADNRHFQYSIFGKKEWRLFGTIIYTEDQDFSGQVAIDRPATR